MKMRKLFTPFAALLVASLLISACAAAAPGEREQDIFLSEPAVGEAMPMEAPAAEPGADFAADEAFAEERGAAGGANAAAVERLVIQNANMSIVVDQPDVVMDEIATLAEELGGFVVDSNLFQTTNATGVEFPSASITVRVPAESMQDVLAEIEGKAVRVVSQNQSGQDVTAQYTDLQSRLRNLEDAAELLRQIMDEARDTEDVLTAFNQLNNITEQIEVLKGQIQFFEESAALSAISVQLIASAAEQTITIGGWEPVGVAKDAIQALINALQNLVDVLIWLVLYVLPIALIIGVPLWLIVRGARRRLANREKAAK